MSDPSPPPGSPRERRHRHHHAGEPHPTRHQSPSQSFQELEGLADTPDFFVETAAPGAGEVHLMEPAVEDCYDDGAMAAQYLTPLTHDIISKTILKVETRNDQLGRTLRVTQKKLNVVGGNNIQTRIEVIDDYLPSAPVMFSVKHTHGTPWARQMIVHKNLFLACILTGVTDPPLEVCKDAQQMFENSENVAHMHSYMERALPRIRFPEGVPQDLRLYWWRAVENGAIVLQNEATGRLILIPNREKRLTTAADTVLKCLALMRHLAISATTGRRQSDTSSPGSTFLTPDPYYPNSLSPSLLSQLVEDPNRQLTEGEMIDVVQHWAADQRVSPWVTQMVVKTRGLRKSQVTHYRYSLDVDQCLPKTLSIQVHANEPLSRELHAFPVCMLTMPILGELTLQNVYLRFVQSLWFMKKLFDFHCETEAWSINKKSSYYEFSSIFGSPNSRCPLAQSSRLASVVQPHQLTRILSQQQALRSGLAQRKTSTRPDCSPSTPCMVDQRPGREYRHCSPVPYDTPMAFKPDRYRSAPSCVTKLLGVSAGSQHLATDPIKFRYSTASDANMPEYPSYGQQQQQHYTYAQAPDQYYRSEFSSDMGE